MNRPELNYIRNIGGLMVGKNADLKDVARHIDAFIDTVPSLTETMQKNMPKNANSINKSLADAIKNALYMLDEVKAVWLYKEGARLLSVADGYRYDYEMCKRLLPEFTASLLSLSISMQTAKDQYSETHANPKNAEALCDTVKNLSAIKTLIENSESSYAAQLLEGMAALSNNEKARQLILTLKDGKDGGDLIDKLINEHNDEIAQIMVELTGIAQRKIMLVDDRPDILETVGGYLKDAYKVFPMTGGTVALKAMEKQKIDLFVLDIDMPEMDGITLAQKIRESLMYRKTPIIMLTSNAGRENVLAAMEAGANDFIVKPANRDMLVAKIADHLTTNA